MYSCDEVIAELASFLDDDLAVEVRQQVEGHLRDCRTCQTLYDSTRKTLRIVTDSGTFEVPSNLTRRIMDSLRSGGGGEGD